MNETPRYSVVIPVNNEEATIEALAAQVCAAMDRLEAPYEVLIVDDGSTDRTWALIAAAARANPHLICYRLNRNFGHQAAICAGLTAARGEAVAIMDGDGQDPPEVLIEMFDRWKQGCDVAYAVRKGRKEGILKRWAYHAFYRMLSRLAAVPIPLDSGDFSVMDRKVAQFILSINDPAPFIRGLRSWYGGKQVAVAYERQARRGGRTKYSWFGLVDLALNGITSLSKLPLRLAIYVGGVISLLSFCYGTFVILRRLFWDFPQGWGWSSVVTLVSFVSGLNLLLLGFVGEYIAHIFDSSKQFPIYLIRESTRQDDAAPQGAVSPDNKSKI